MTDERKRAFAQAAAGRLFRVYQRHCVAPDLDTLFETLTALHSLNDRLKKAAGRDLHEHEEFQALKVLRNFAHHHEEIASNVRVIPTPAASDLLFMCIVRRDQVVRAISNVQPKWRAASRKACETHFLWYGQAVNINPCLFNSVVRTYELLLEVDILAPEDDVAALKASYDFETEEGHSHFVTGQLRANAAELDGVLNRIATELPSL